eukprot:TRINITY_DN109091_c0_g1_i1.p1 TRINITY_DN109091_c0_g1~~TRINITY_DN109091_c0_g1_i1.p1  ORF type:complete len:257 (+),score=67.75 TRINITY_DN109091_c0_g1_i1:106-876(+)
MGNTTGVLPDLECERPDKVCTKSGCGDLIAELPSAVGGPEEISVDQILLSSARDGNLSIVQECLRNGADVGARLPVKLVTLDRYQNGHQVRNHGLTPLMQAARGGHSKVVAELLRFGSRVNDEQEDGVTVLHYAAAGGDLDTFRLLLENGARWDAEDHEGEGVLDYLPQTVTGDNAQLKAFKEMIEKWIEGTLGPAAQKESPPPNPHGQGPAEKSKSRMDSDDPTDAKEAPKSEDTDAVNPEKPEKNLTEFSNLLD